ncbi:MAG: glycosyltransferase family 39 protein [Acidobacteria bacterium]|nr:glycosyltransferase family 39 protein [Acidobacteriota bacterium]
MRQFLILLLICWLPGAALFRLPWMDRDRRASLDAEERVFWAVIISLAVSLSVLLVLAALHRYSFERLLTANVLVAAGALVISRGRLRLGPAARRPGLTVALPILLILLGVWRFFPPSEYIIGGKDPGVYMNSGIQIAQRGTLWYEDPVIASLPPGAWELFQPWYGRSAYYSTRFMGFFIQDPDTGVVVSQFPHLFPASIALGYGVDGLTGARRVTGVWAVLGVLAVYFASTRLFGRRAAVLGAVLLTLHVVQVWFARYPNTEVVMQTLLFAAFLAYARAHVDEDRFFGPVAGVLLGLLLFLRFDAVLGVAAVVAGAAAAALHGVRPRASMWLPFGAMAVLGAAYTLGPMRGYAERPIIYLTNLPWTGYAALAAVVAALAIALLAAPRMPRLGAAIGRWLPTVAALSLIAGAIYALFFRVPGGRLAAHDADALRTYADFYVSLPAVLAALAGYALYARRSFWRAPAFFLAVPIFGFFFFYKIHVVPEHFWMARRFLAVILPMTLVLAAALAFGDQRAGRRRFLQWTVGLLFIGLVGTQYQRASRPILDHVEYAGMIPRLEELAGRIADDELVIAESRDAGSDVHVLALPLAYIYNRNVLLLANPTPDRETLAAFLEFAGSRYRRVLFLGSGGTALLSHRYGVRALASEQFQVPEYDAPLNAYPRFVTLKEFDYGLYEFTPPQPHDGLWFDLDVGVRDDLHVVRFHAKEETDGRTFRWTQAQSFVTVTVVPPGARQATLWMHNGGRPPGAPPATIRVYFHGEPLGTVQVEDGWREYRLSIPAAVAARAAEVDDPVELRLVTTTWNPQVVLGTPDDRELGVMLDRVTIR